MGKVIIREKWTTKEPLSLIGESAGICWESPTDDDLKNVKRAIDCYYDGHGRTLEFPDIYIVLDGYSARVIREWYTHLGGSPTRLQSSTRYVDAKNFKFVTPNTIKNNPEATEVYNKIMSDIAKSYEALENIGVPKEDCALCLPLGMETKIVDKRNLRNLVDMSRQRMCTRAYHEYREIMKDLCEALSNYSPQWKWIVENMLMPKCEFSGTCPEKRSCGRKPKSEVERNYEV